LGAAHFAKQKIIIVFCFCKIRNPAAAQPRSREGEAGKRGGGSAGGNSVLIPF